ncbi:MAG: hypothetical protein ABIL15_01410 [candidate division WOR-3 bacterium]
MIRLQYRPDGLAGSFHSQYRYACENDHLTIDDTGGDNLKPKTNNFRHLGILDF